MNSKAVEKLKSVLFERRKPADYGLDESTFVAHPPTEPNGTGIGAIEYMTLNGQYKIMIEHKKADEFTLFTSAQYHLPHNEMWSTHLAVPTQLKDLPRHLKQAYEWYWRK